MNATRLDALTAFLQAIRDYLAINDQYRQAWRYIAKRAGLKESRRQALQWAETRRNQLHNLLIENPSEPTYLDRQARVLIEKWDNRTHQLEIYRAEKNGNNLAHLHEAETALKKQCSIIIEVIKKTA